MRKVKRLILFFISFAYITGSSFALENKNYEQCFINSVKNNKTGYSYVVEKQDVLNSKKVIITKKYTEIEFQKYGLPIKMISNIEYIETINGKPIAIKASLESLDNETNYTATFIDNNKIELITSTNNDTTTEIIEYKDDILLPFAIGNLFKGNFSNEIKYQTIDLSSEFRLVNITASKETYETINVNDKEVGCTKYKVIADVLPNVGNYQWFDKNGRLQKEYSSILNIEQIAASKETVLKPETTQNIYYENLIPIDSKIENIENIKQVTYKVVSFSIKNLDNLFIDNQKQKVIQSLDNTVYLKVKNDKNVEETDKVSTNKYLKPNYFITLDRLEVQELAKMYKNKEQDKYTLAKSLENWVFENIQIEPFEADIKPAFKTINALKGSASEANLVLLSLLRACDIPSRPIIGMKYIETPQNAFGFYLWVEAFIDGKWRRLDAPNPKFAKSPIYIGFKKLNLDYKNDIETILLPFIKDFSNYKISILNISQNVTNKISANNNKTSQNKDNFNLLGILRSGDKYLSDIKKTEEKNDKQKIQLKDDYLNKGYISISDINFEKATEFFQKASAMQSYGDDFNNMNYAHQMASLGLFSISKEYLEQVYDIEIWNKQIANLKNIYFPKNIAKNNEDKYFKAFSKLRFNKGDFKIQNVFSSDEYKKDETAQFILGLNYYKHKDYKQSSKLFKKAIKLNKNNYVYKLKLADSFLHENKPKNTLKVIKELEKKNIKDLYFNRELKKLKYLALSKFNKKTEEKRYYLAKYHLLINEKQKSLELLSKTIEENLHHSKTYSLFADLTFTQENIDTTQSYIQKALTLDDKNIQAILLKGDIENQKNNIEEALKCYRKVLNIDSSNQEAIIKIADIHKKELNDYKAIHLLERVKPYKASDEIYYNLAELYLIVGDKENAIANFKKALCINPLNDNVWFKLSELYLNDKNTFIAKYYLKPLKKINPNYKYYYYMGVIEKLNGNYDIAQKFFEKSIQLNPSSKAQEEL